jgi:hypothetical protein
VQYSWCVRSGNLCIMHSIPDRFVLSEIVGEKQRLITLYDKELNFTVAFDSVIEAMLNAERHPRGGLQ